MPETRVAVVVVTWNSAAVVGELLNSLPEGLAGVPWYLVVADNASADDTVHTVENWLADHGGSAQGCVVQTGSNAGYSAAINRAFAHSATLDGKPFSAAFILNPDIRLQPDCAATLVAALHTDTDASVGITVPRMLDESGRLTPSLRREPTLLRALGEAVLGGRAGRFPRLGEVVLDESAYRAPTVADWATGAIMMISADCMTACGPWDESFFLYSEETEFALRARDLGFLTRLIPEATAVHLGGESGVSAKLWTLLTINKVRLYHRRHHLPASAAYWAVALLREAPRAVLGKQRSRAAAAGLLSPARLRRPDAGMH
ncbi:MAG TPA: glycosyltransferase family 2 protein [Actinocrinis sp.]|nr:glycosyltransferase family 2 protein [Actinocrinis sp.]